MYSSTSLFSAAYLLSHSFVTHSKPVNVTVDDAHGDPITNATIHYGVSPGWQVGPNCTACQAAPDSTQTYMGTWHEAVYNVSNPGVPPEAASFNFTGSAIYVFGILAHSFAAPVSNTQLLFIVDGAQAGTFDHSPDSEQPEYTYNFPLYANDSLPYAAHTVAVQNAEIGTTFSLVLLDYLIYTMDDGIPILPITSLSLSDPSSAAESTTPSSSSTTTSFTSNSRVSPTPSGDGGPSNHETVVIILATVIPVVTLVALLLAALVVVGWLYYRHQSRTQQDDRLKPPRSSRMSTVLDALLRTHPALSGAPVNGFPHGIAEDKEHRKYQSSSRATLPSPLENKSARRALPPQVPIINAPDDYSQRPPSPGNAPILHPSTSHANLRAAAQQPKRLSTLPPHPTGGEDTFLQDIRRPSRRVHASTPGHSMREGLAPPIPTPVVYDREAEYRRSPIVGHNDGVEQHMRVPSKSEVQSRQRGRRSQVLLYMSQISHSDHETPSSSYHQGRLKNAS